MDEAKLDKLKEVGWRTAHTCRTCLFGTFQKGADWGTCSKKDNFYEHTKHKRTHPLPAFIGATCDNWHRGELANQVSSFLKNKVTSFREQN